MANDTQNDIIKYLALAWIAPPLGLLLDHLGKKKFDVGAVDFLVWYALLIPVTVYVLQKRKARQAAPEKSV